MTPKQIDKLIKRRDKLLTRRDGLYDHSVIDRIDAQLRDVPPGQNNEVDLALGRSCAIHPLREFIANADALIAAEIEECPQDWQNMRGDLAL